MLAVKFLDELVIASTSSVLQLQNLRFTFSAMAAGVSNNPRQEMTVKITSVLLAIIIDLPPRRVTLCR